MRWIILLATAILITGCTQVEYTPNITENITNAFNQGLVTAISQLVRNTDNCNIAVITYGNSTRQMIDIACLNITVE